MVDPSHATGVRYLVKPMSIASLAAGADGIMVEVHPNPSEALSDGPQSLHFEEFKDLMESIKNYKKLRGFKPLLFLFLKNKFVKIKKIVLNLC
ncbi:hypothetical protein Q5M85_21890 [Paraclostridium bifermentans]|nr:hypothetical protein [Paraclostridium bifermentans]